MSSERQEMVIESGAVPEVEPVMNEHQEINYMINQYNAMNHPYYNYPQAPYYPPPSYIPYNTIEKQSIEPPVLPYFNNNNNQYNNVETINNNEEENSEFDVDQYVITTAQKESPYTILREKYDALLKENNHLKEKVKELTNELNNVKRKRDVYETSTNGNVMNEISSQNGMVNSTNSNDIQMQNPILQQPYYLQAPNSTTKKRRGRKASQITLINNNETNNNIINHNFHNFSNGMDNPNVVLPPTDIGSNSSSNEEDVTIIEKSSSMGNMVLPFTNEPSKNSIMAPTTSINQGISLQSSSSSDKARDDIFQQLQSNIASLPSDLDLSRPIPLNKAVLIYYYDSGVDGHGNFCYKANGKRIFIDINWNEVRTVDTYLFLCIFVNTSTVDKVRDSDLIATFKILKTDGSKVKISKIRDNLRKLNLQNQFSNIGHIKFFIQVRGQDSHFEYTDKILLYSKTQHNVINFEPTNQKEYAELTKLFYEPERFVVFKKRVDGTSELN
ncbi:hypothetical protein ABK040_005159 [Willaertia magna]